MDQPVLAIGTPGNRPGVVTVGKVVRPRLEKRIRYDDFGLENPMELKMHVEPGHSGGPVFDGEGRLLGMIVGFDLRRIASGEFINTGTVYAVPAGDLMEFARRWITFSGNI